MPGSFPSLIKLVRGVENLLSKGQQFRIPLKQIRIPFTRGKNYYIVDFPQGKFSYNRGKYGYIAKFPPEKKLLYSHFSGGGEFYYIAIFPGGKMARGKNYYTTPYYTLEREIKPYAVD